MTEQAMDWQELTNLTRGQPFVVERVRLAAHGVAIHGEFELPQLAQLNVADQVFFSAILGLAALGAGVACLVFRVSAARALDPSWRIVSALPGPRLDLEQGRTAVFVAIR